MRIVIAGGAGFLGSHLADLHVERGDEIVILDDFTTGSLANVAHLDGNPSVEVVDADVSAEVPVTGVVDRVYNLASPASPPAYLERRLETLAVSPPRNFLAEILKGFGPVPSNTVSCQDPSEATVIS